MDQIIKLVKTARLWISGLPKLSTAGGSTGAGKEKLHLTERGRRVELTSSASEWSTRRATGQFEISDDRSPEEIAAVIARHGYEPVWKDWDAALVSA